MLAAPFVGNQGGRAMSKEGKFVDHYAVMGLKETASTEEIGRAYKKLARKLHPDKAKNRGQAAQEAAAAKFHDLQQSYEVLRDEKKREKFDAKIKARVMAKKRHEELDAERRKMKDALERREKEASEGRTPSWRAQGAAGASSGEAARRARLNRIREENRQAMDRFLHKKRHEAAARAEFAAARAAESGAGRAAQPAQAAAPEVEEAAGAVTAFSEGIRERSVLLVSWGETGLGGEDGSAGEAHVAGYFRKYGSVRDVLVLPSRRQALLRFGTPAPAARASLDVHPEFLVTLARELPPALSSGERKRKRRERKEMKKARKRERKERKRRRGVGAGEGSEAGSGDEVAESRGGEAGGAARAAGSAAEAGRPSEPHDVGGAGLSFAAYEEATLRAILGERVDLPPAVSA